MLITSYRRDVPSNVSARGPIRGLALMSQREHRLLVALTLMVDQYLSIGGGTLDNLAMHAGETAFRVLSDHGLVTLDNGEGSRFAKWTDAGRQLLANQRLNHLGRDATHNSS
jgi:hypothetical protein